MGSKNRAWAHSATRNGALCSTILPTVRLASSMTFPPDLPYLIASKPIFVVPYALFQLNKLKAVMLCRNKNAKCSSNQPTVTPMTGLYLLFSSEQSFVFFASFLFEKKRRGTRSAEWTASASTTGYGIVDEGRALCEYFTILNCTLD